MKKFLVIGLGGSGGATVRYIMDELKADLRRKGINDLPKAWQFLHIDVNPVPETTKGLGDVRSLGGRYVAVGSAGKNFESARSTVESRLKDAGSLNSLIGWTPIPRNQANHVNIAKGAGQYRAVGRMLTLTNLDPIRAAINNAWEDLQSVDSWGELPLEMRGEGPYDSAGAVVPIVISSMAGGAGASMFLDVSRILGRIQGIQSNQVGLFLFTPDVFASLDASKRMGIDGNALGAFGEVLAAQMRSGTAHDQELLRAMGMPVSVSDEQVFGRVFPIGSSIGGSGARFGNTVEDIYRGLGRALAGTIISEEASTQYLKSKLENPISPTDGQSILGWGADPDRVVWGSFGYSSLSLGRDRYAHYASQRLARQCVDQLLRGYLDETSTLTPTEQLDTQMSNQRDVIRERMGLAADLRNLSAWLRSWPLEQSEQMRVAEEATESVNSAIERHDSTSQTTAAWIDDVKSQLPQHEPKTKNRIASSAYIWAEGFAREIEDRILTEVLRLAAHPKHGLPFARHALIDLERHLVELARGLATVRRDQRTLWLSDKFNVKTAVTQEVRNSVRQELVSTTKDAYARECAQWASKVLLGVVSDVLPALRTAINRSLEVLEAAEQTLDTDAGLAQLHTTKYREWPTNSDDIPTRFNQAFNEVLLTTANEFPARFREHVEQSRSDATYDSGLEAITEEISRGYWENVGAKQASFEVLRRDVHWRSADLRTDGNTNDPTPHSSPRYSFAFKTDEILARADEYQRRKDQAFELFSSETFEGYLNAAGISESEVVRRRDELVQKFEEALAQANPLIGVDAATVEALHKLKLEIEYTFSAVPLTPGSATATQVESMLARSPHLEKQSVERFAQALKTEEQSSRISIFGSYPKYYPLVFASFLKQLKDRWAGETEVGKRELWRWKRTRPIPAAIGMSPIEMSTVIKSWYLGRALGLIDQPKDTHSAGSVAVYDVNAQEWRRFESRLLTSPEQFKNTDGFDWLPAVLEGHTLAIVNSANDDTFASLLPYKVLREIFDSGIEPSRGAMTNGERLIQAWLETGTLPSNNPSPIDALKQLDNDASSRAEGLQAWLKSVQQHVEKKYLVKGNSPANANEFKLRVDHVDKLESLPLFAEIAVDVHRALGELILSVQKSLNELVKTADQDEVPQI